MDDYFAHYTSLPVMCLAVCLSCKLTLLIPLLHRSIKDKEKSPLHPQKSLRSLLEKCLISKFDGLW